MSLTFIFSIITAVSIFLLGVGAFLNNRRRLVNRVFLIMDISVVFWILSVILRFNVGNPLLILFSARMSYTAATFVAFLINYFCYCVPQKNNYKFPLFPGLLLTVLVSFLSLFTPYILNDIKLINNLQENVFGQLYLIFVFFFTTNIGWSIYNLLSKRPLLDRIGRAQINFILIGNILSTGIGFTTNSIIPLLIKTSVTEGYGPLSPLIFILLASYAILKYHLFEIRVILTELLVGAVALILLIQALTAPTFGLKIFGGVLLILFSIVGYLLIKSVLTEIKRREESERLSSELAAANIKLRAAYKKLEELDRAKSEFISIASHQLRTPLSAIKGYISMLLEKTYGELPGKAKGPLENVYLSCERLIKLVNDLLNISRIEAGKMEMNFEKLDLEEIIKDVVEEMQIRAKEKNLYLKYETPEGKLPKILLDGNKIRQVILNVVDNGIRYTEKGGVTIKLQIVNGKLQIVVSDTGEGMTKYELSKLFESFSRGSAGQRIWTEGIGLGLYVSKKFVELHNGKIWAESEGKGKGSTFYIELPIK